MMTLPISPTLASAQPQDNGTESRRVVILNATDPYLPAFLALDGALRDAIRTLSNAPTDFYAETLDMHRFPRAQLDQHVVTMLQNKYRDLNVDVVVADAQIALDFAQRYRDEIWPGAVIVFNSVPSSVLHDHELALRTIGVPVIIEFGQTLDLALKLRPATRRIAVIAGAADPDRGYLALAKTSLERYLGKIDIEYLVGRTVNETIAAVEALPADALVLYLTLFRDGDGVPQVPREVLQRIAAVSPVPVFGVFETYLGYGIAAGSITTYQAQGRAAGALVARVLNGEDPSSIGVQEPALSSCMADWKQLQRWRIDSDLLPEDCEIRFKPDTVWDRYQWQILTVLAIIAVQSVLIVALTWSHNRLKQMQATVDDQIKQRSQAEKITNLLRLRIARFARQHSLGTMVTTITHEINQPLTAIQNYAQAVRRRLDGEEYDKTRIIELFMKIERQAERAGDITRRVRSLINNAEPSLMPTPLCPLFEEVIRMMETECEDKGCCIECEPAIYAPDVLVDPLQVQLVMVNLLHNAMQSVCSSDRYNKRVSVDLRKVNTREVQVSVTDCGEGVPPERAAYLFDPLDSGTSTGMGMGLAICQQIVAAHRGRLWFEPNPAGGAVFRFTLQIAGT